MALEEVGAGTALLEANSEDIAKAEVNDVLTAEPTREPVRGFQERRARHIDRTLTEVQEAHQNGNLQEYQERAAARAEELEEGIEIAEKTLRELEPWLQEARERTQAGDGEATVGDDDILLHGDLPTTAEVDGTHTWTEVRENLRRLCDETENELRRKRRHHSLHLFRVSIAEVFEEELHQYDERTALGENYPKPHWSGLKAGRRHEQEEDGEGSGRDDAGAQITVPGDLFEGKGTKPRHSARKNARKLKNLYERHIDPDEGFTLPPDEWSNLHDKLEQPMNPDVTEGRNQIGRVRDAFKDHPDVDEPGNPIQLCKYCWIYFNDVVPKGG